MKGDGIDGEPRKGKDHNLTTTHFKLKILNTKHIFNTPHILNILA